MERASRQIWSTSSHLDQCSKCLPIQTLISSVDSRTLWDTAGNLAEVIFHVFPCAMNTLSHKVTNCLRSDSPLVNDAGGSNHLLFHAARDVLQLNACYDCLRKQSET